MKIKYRFVSVAIRITAFQRLIGKLLSTKADLCFISEPIDYETFKITRMQYKMHGKKLLINMITYCAKNSQEL